MIVGVREELHQNLADDTDTRTTLFRDRQGVEVADDLFYISPEFSVTGFL